MSREVVFRATASNFHAKNSLFIVIWATNRTKRSYYLRPAARPRDLKDFISQGRSLDPAHKARDVGNMF